jgi:hypothetical protein
MVIAYVAAAVSFIVDFFYFMNYYSVLVATGIPLGFLLIIAVYNQGRYEKTKEEDK